MAWFCEDVQYCRDAVTIAVVSALVDVDLHILFRVFAYGSMEYDTYFLLLYSVEALH